MNPLTCKFCYQDTEKINQYYELTTPVIAWRCESCQARFLSTDFYQILEVKLYCQINNKRFCAKFTYDELASSHTVSKFELSEMWNSFDTPCALSLDYYPDVTPYNIKYKIPTLIIFK